MKRFGGLVAFVVLLGLPGGVAEAASLPPQAEALVSRALGGDDARYRVGLGRTASNPAQRLTARFGAAGARVRAAGSTTGLTLRGVGRGSALRSAGAAVTQVTANEVSYRRNGLTEWYVNGPSGLEHGFTLRRRPAGGSGGPLTLALDLAGDLVARLDADGRGVSLDGRDGSARLVYRGLWAADARGRHLKAWLELRGKRLLIRVDDAGARYPLTIDPFFQGAKLTATDAATNDRLGSSVAISGDTIVAGAPDDDGTGLDQGSVYVFVKPAGGWVNATQVAKLTASDGAAGHSLGQSVAIYGDTIVAGAPGANKVYVFVKPPGGWASGTQNARLTVPGLASFADLGISVDIEGDVVAAGAQYSNAGGATNEGAAYVFEKGSAWADKTQSATLVNFYGEAEDRLGYSVAIGASGATIVAGVPSDDVGTAPVSFDQGSVVVFNRPGATWAIAGGGIEYHEATLFAPDGTADDQLGYGVAMEGNTIVVGALFADFAGRVNQGVVYVWQGAVLSWTPKTKLVASDGVAGDALGWRVGISGNTIVAGAIGADGFRGSAYVFRDPGSGWENAAQIAKLTASDGVGSDNYSEGLAVSGGTVAVGSIGANGSQGAAYVYVEDASAPVAPALSGASPASPSNVNARTISGSAEAGSYVRLYGAAGCIGPVLAEGSAAQLASPGLALTVGDNSTTSLYATATDVAGNVSACSTSPLTVVEDSAAPAAPAISGPARVTAGVTARFTASVDDGAGSGVAPAAVSWTASGGLPARSGNAVDYTFPAAGTYTLRVTAADRAGNTSRTSTFVVTVDPVKLPTTVSYAVRFFKTYTRFVTLSARRGVPAGATIRVTCSGRGCPFKSKTLKQRKNATTVSLTKLFNRKVGRRTVAAKLRVKAKVEVRITAPSTIGRYRLLTIRSNKLPKSKDGCLAAATNKRIRC